MTMTKWRVGGRAPYQSHAHEAADIISETFGVAYMDPRCLAWECSVDGTTIKWRWELKHLPTGCECEAER